MGEQKTRGVIRLLQEGHFKGVADVRLRINFFDELSGRAAQAALPVLRDGANELVETIKTGVDELIATLELDEEQQEAIGGLAEEFEAAVRAAADELAAQGPGDPDALAAAFRSVFDAFVEQMGSLLAPPPVNPEPDEEPIPNGELVPDGAAPLVEALSVDGGPAPDGVAPLDVAPPADVAPTPGAEPVPFEQALAALRAQFDEALSLLLTSINSVTQLPDPSPPHGNGAAYDKFLAMYNELRGLTPEVDEKV